VTVGDRDQDRSTVIKERELNDRATAIKKEDADGDRTKDRDHHDIVNVPNKVGVFFIQPRHPL
jgi:hypothetical protein